jgi:exopolysaccharide biosynthesis protein
MRSIGVTHAQAASYLLAHGASAAMLFDSGGSSTIVARLYGQHYVSVVNWPSDGFERPVANGLFVYHV